MPTHPTSYAIERLRHPAVMQYFRDHGIAHVSLFGSFARGDNTEKSDLDLAVVYDDTFRLSAFTYGKFMTGLKRKLRLGVKKIDTIDLKNGNPILRSYIQKDLIEIF